MKKILLILGMTLVLTGGLPTSAKDRTSDKEKTEKIKFGYDGGMMLHTGYLQGTIPQISHQAKGMPFGIGGAIKFHIGKHFRVGSEGYVSNLKQLKNGSTVNPVITGERKFAKDEHLLVLGKEEDVRKLTK